MHGKFLMQSLAGGRVLAVGFILFLCLILGMQQSAERTPATKQIRNPQGANGVAPGLVFSAPLAESRAEFEKAVKRLDLPAALRGPFEDVAKSHPTSPILGAWAEVDGKKCSIENLGNGFYSFTRGSQNLSIPVETAGKDERLPEKLREIINGAQEAVHVTMLAMFHTESGTCVYSIERQIIDGCDTMNIYLDVSAQKRP